MGNVLKIKSRTSGATGAPGSLAQSELAYNEQDNTLYIGHGSGTDANRTKKAIAGVGAFVDLATAQTLTNKTISGDGSGLSGITAGNINGVVPSANLPDASTSVEGVVELATTAETNTGTDTTRAVTPAGLTAWTGDTNLVTVGTISAGTWSGTKLVAGKVPNLEDLTVGGNVTLGNNYRITGLAAPVAANDAARKTDVDAAVQGLDVRESVRVGSTGNLTLSGTQTIDNIPVVAGDRVLAKNQTTASENGIYVVAASAWSRSADLNATADCSPNMFFFVEEGDSYADTGWVCTTDGTVTLSNLAFAQFSGTGTYTGGSGIDLSGTTFSADLKSNGGLEIQSSKIALNLSSSAITGTLAISDGGTGATSDSAARTALGVAIGSDVQAYDAQLADIAGLSPTANNMIVGNGSNFVLTTAPDGLTINGGTF